MTIAEDLLTLITADNSNWASNPTKKEYIHSKSDSRALNLDNPVLVTDQVILVIFDASRSLLNELGGANVYLYEGDIFIHGLNYDDCETAQTRLKTIGDAQYSLKIINQMITTDSYKKRFLTITRYEWQKLVNDG